MQDNINKEDKQCKKILTNGNIATEDITHENGRFFYI
jgi:hypothetical protein